MSCGRQHCGADGINDRWVKIEYKKDKYGWGVGGYVSVESYAAMEGRAAFRRNGAIAEPRNGGGAKAQAVELARHLNGRA